MNRNEQISEAANAYAPFDVASVHSVARAFYDGAKWADANPTSMWRSVEDELPEKGQKVIIRYFGSSKDDFNETHFCELEYNSKEGLELIESMLKSTGLKITHWMSIPEL